MIKDNQTSTFEVLIYSCKENYIMLFGEEKLKRINKKLWKYHSQDQLLNTFEIKAPQYNEFISILKRKIYFQFCSKTTLDFACLLVLEMWHKRYNMNYKLMDKDQLKELAMRFIKPV